MARVLIIGAGWAGLAAALELLDADYEVEILEAAKQAGGRARALEFNGHSVDNGQHLLIGAYHATLDLLHRAGVDTSQALLRLPLQLKVLSQQYPEFLLKAPHLPAPLHLAAALLSAKALPWSERLGALRMSLKLQLSGFALTQDCSVHELLSIHQQGPNIRRLLWEPLCLATLNTPSETASARSFLRVIKDSFIHRRQDSELLIPARDLSELFVSPLLQAIKDKGGRLHLRRRVTRIEQDDTQGYSVTCRDGQQYRCEQLVIATSPQALPPLIEPLADMQEISRKVQQLEYQSVSTVYLQYPHALKLQPAMIGMVDGLAQWIFDRGALAQEGLAAVVISGKGPHLEMGKEELAGKIIAELATAFPHWQAPTVHQVVHEKRATFDCRVGVEQLRPCAQTPMAGLWLAGDYTDTGYPATLEGAVLSGLQCAQAIQHKNTTGID